MLRLFRKKTKEVLQSPIHFKKIWISCKEKLGEQRSEFYNRSLKSWLYDNGIETYSAYNEGKSFVVKRFIRALKNKIHKLMTAVSKNV